MSTAGTAIHSNAPKFIGVSLIMEKAGSYMT